VDRIARAMFALSLDDPEQAKILETAGMAGIIPTKDEDYDSIRRLSERLNLHDPSPVAPCTESDNRGRSS
jgi:phosphonate transport system substrate-binding protein